MTGAVLAFMLGPSYELVKLKDHKENEVYLVDDSLMGDGRARLVYTIPEAREGGADE